MYQHGKDSMLKAIIFDLDGTLVDTLPDVTVIMNSVLRDHGFPLHSMQEYRTYMGWGSREMSRRSLPAEARTEANIRVVDEEMRELYGACDNALSRAYPGVADALSGLSKRSLLLAVLSNKPDRLAALVVRKFFPDIPFARVRGARDGVPHKPDPTGALSLARELGVQGAECLFVGDSDVDMLTAKNAGMVPAAVSWGYRDVSELKAAGAVHILSSLNDLAPLLD